MLISFDQFDMRKKLYPIKNIKDWDGEDWDVFEERKARNGVILSFGWPYGETRKGKKSLILTAELAEHVKCMTWGELMDVFGLTGFTATKIRHKLNLCQVQTAWDYSWIMAHQDEILNDSFTMLFEKYGLNRKTVSGYKSYLVNKLELPHKVTRHFEKQHQAEKLYHQYKAEVAQCNNLKEVQDLLKTDRYIARKFHKLACEEFQVPIIGEKHATQLEATWQWRIQHQDQILNAELSVQDIAVQLNVTRREIHNARKTLRQRLNIEETIGFIGIQKWVLEHETELKTLTLGQLKEKYQITKGQITYRRRLLNRIKSQNIEGED